MIMRPHELMDVAYKKLKQMVYCDKNNLMLRRRLAEFECGNDFEMRLKVVADVVELDDPVGSETFQSWLNEIDFVLVPKGVIAPPEHDANRGSFVTNVTSSARYIVGKVNYLFDGPVELHLLAVLWLMTEGQKFDDSLSRHCLGSRLHELVGQVDDRSAHLFQKYHELYAKWRDDGIEKARALLTTEEQSVCILSLDIQEFYYRIQLDWKEFKAQVRRPMPTNGMARAFEMREICGGRLFDCVEAICKSYHEKIKEFLSTTHSDLPTEATCLPIGLCSSPVIANWYLKEFDAAILTKIRPAYYGRYVDDILLVMVSEKEPEGDPIKDFMDRVLVDNGIMTWDGDEQRYELRERPGLYLQEKKCILQFFDAGHSIAGLDKFKKQIEDNASAFALLPLEGDESPVAQVAYDLMYDGSVNKFRNVKAIAENRWELANHLAKQTQLHLLTVGMLDKELKKELFRFFKGRNAIDYWDMWERVVSFLLVAENSGAAESFRDAMHKEVVKVYFSKDQDGQRVFSPKAQEIWRKLRKDLGTHLELCLELSLAVRDAARLNENSPPNIWRESNLIRHHLVAIPLLNYTNFNGDLTSHSHNIAKLKVRKRKADLSPRFVHFDECLSFIDSGYAVTSDADSVTNANELYARFHGNELEDVQVEMVDADKTEST